MVCGDREDLYGGRCYTEKCPPGALRSAVSTCLLQVTWRGNTHLRVVNQALALLRSVAGNDVAAAQAIARLGDTGSSCYARMAEGLWDADGSELKDSNNMGTHFWNAYDGEAGSSANARGLASDHVSKAGAVTTDNQCHELGLALHYMTDLTQPMHATGFTGISVPTMLHPVWEDYVPFIQANYVGDVWDQQWKGSSPDAVLVAAAERSAAYWTRRDGTAGWLRTALIRDAGICTITPEPLVTYTGFCFPHDTTVDGVTGTVLVSAYNSTASYLHAVIDKARTADRTLLTGAGPEVYIMAGGKASWIPGPSIFDAMGLDWSAITTISDADLRLVPRGPLLLRGSGPSVYLVEGGVRRWITSAEVFEGRGYDWAAILTVTDTQLGLIPDGPPVRDTSPWPEQL
jgi:phospholipase C